MNIIEIWISNITVDEPTECEYVRHLVADKNTNGRIEENASFYVTKSEYESIKKHGFYMGQVVRN